MNKRKRTRKGKARKEKIGDGGEWGNRNFMDFISISKTIGQNEKRATVPVESHFIHALGLEKLCATMQDSRDHGRVWDMRDPDGLFKVCAKDRLAGHGTRGIAQQWLRIYQVGRDSKYIATQSL